MQTYRLAADDSDYPARLQCLSNPVATLYGRGAPLRQLLEGPTIAIVGSRKPSAYGRQVTEQLAGQLASLGLVIISGLAIGVDSLVHKATLEAGGLTVAVLPASIDQIYPAAHQPLAERIIQAGGAVVSEYPSGQPTYKEHFIARNRIVAGLGDALLITEAAVGSGTLHTAEFALEQGKTVLVVPGNITSPQSVGANNLLKVGAVPVTRAQDVLHALDLTLEAVGQPTARGRTPAEQVVLDLLANGISDGATLLERSQLSAGVFNQVLTMLELRGVVRALGANHWAAT